jgi:tetratricopeptide (TPR) repeat protein
MRLIKTADGSSLWSDTFDEKFTDIFVVQDAISKKVAEALKLRLSGDAQTQPEKRSTQNVEAYRFYLQGRYHALKATPPEIRQGIEFYQKAIAADPNYALALAGMAQAYAALPITSDVPPNEAFPQAKAAAQKALEIDANLAEAHIILGVVEFWFDWDWTKAEAELKKAIEINPNNSDAHRFYAVLLTVLGRPDEALAEMETARQLDPLSLITNALKGQSFFYAGRDAEAIDQSNKTLEIEPNFWIAHIMLARVYIRQNRFDEAFAEAKKAGEFSGGNSEAVSLAAYALAKAERRDEALATLEELKSRSNERYVPSYNFAMIYNGFGMREEALNQLEKAFTERDARMILLKVEPKWNNLRSEPRFIALIKQMNFEK